MRSNCKTYRTEIEEARRSIPLGREARAHLETCDACLDFHDSQAALIQLVGELEKIPAPADFEFRLRARMAVAGKERRGAFSLLKFAPGFASVALAACFGLAVFGSFYLRQLSTVDSTAGRTDMTPAALPAMEARGEATDTTVDATTSADEPPEKAAYKSATQVAHVAVTAGRRRPARARTASVPVRTRERETSADFSSRTAQAFDLKSENVNGVVASNAPVVAIPLRTSPESLKVLLRDEQGGTRILSMKRVSFGSQVLVGRARETATASASEREGVW